MVRKGQPKAVTTTHEETERSAAKVSKDGRRHFGSQIEESDSEEIMETATTTSPDDTSTVVSVASFSNMCKVCGLNLSSSNLWLFCLHVCMNQDVH